ncbi:hypothetical protein F4810DRAFT_247327 [Camillea tinctor]|nr:hypothetical protein F4810DRAFT_247327 [Camillea tinctor]
MTSTPEPKNTGSPEITMAIRPYTLTKEMRDLNEARQASEASRTAYENFSHRISSVTEPGGETQEPNIQDSLRLASMGIEVAMNKKAEIRLERNIIAKKRDAGQMDHKEAEKCISNLNKRYLSVGDDLWSHQKKKTLLQTGPEQVRLWWPNNMAASECLLALYAKCDGLSDTKRPQNWRRDVLDYYQGSPEPHDDVQEAIWCHISGQWWSRPTVKAAHIVPFFARREQVCEMLFGSRSEDIYKGSNGLLLFTTIESWFDKYHIVVVPADATETPITRWRTEVVNPHIRKSLIGQGFTGQDIDGKELVFRNHRRPAAYFMYFHFIMALIRIKDLKREGWREIWARYYTQQPFPTPGPYIRKQLLLGLASHYEATDIESIGSWLNGNGFETPIILNASETNEMVRRVLEAATPSKEDEDPDEDGDLDADKEDSEEEEEEDD